jgi:hypothetical protein
VGFVTLLIYVGTPPAYHPHTPGIRAISQLVEFSHLRTYWCNEQLAIPQQFKLVSIDPRWYAVVVAVVGTSGLDRVQVLGLFLHLQDLTSVVDASVPVFVDMEIAAIGASTLHLSCFIAHAPGQVNRTNRGRTHGRTDQYCTREKVLANSEPMVWTPPFQPVECRTWTAARENHHAGRSDRLGLGKVRV